MKVKARISDQVYLIYREKWGSLFYIILLSLVCIGLGSASAFYMADHGGGQVFRWAGYGFILVGLLVLSSLPKTIKAVQRDGGFIQLKATKEGLAITPIYSLELSHYRWDQVKKILIVDELIVKDSDGEQVLKKQILFVFHSIAVKKGLLKDAREFRSYGEGDQVYTSVPCPKDQPYEQVAQDLRKFVPENIEVSFQEQFR